MTGSVNCGMNSLDGLMREREVGSDENIDATDSQHSSIPLLVPAGIEPTTSGVESRSSAN